jgi:diguanylate cyclase (GGDEF)-like protein
MSTKSANLAIVINNTLESRTPLDLHHYDISSALQTTLEFNELVVIFCNKIQSVIPHSGFEYTNELFNLNIKNGIVTRHACTYTLKIEEQELGELKLMRGQKFAQHELKQLETLLCCLIYPLRNATLFRQAVQMAYTDPLTKVNNRAAFNDTINREFNLAKRTGRNLSMIFLDIDHFKRLNDDHGHECGYMALAAVAGWIKNALRGTDIVFRYGGEEFVIVLGDTDLSGATLIAERVRSEINSHALAYGMKVLNITASLGVSTVVEGDTVATFIQRADQAMYSAKRNGRNQVVQA